MNFWLLMQNFNLHVIIAHQSADLCNEFSGIEFGQQPAVQNSSDFLGYFVWRA